MTLNLSMNCLYVVVWGLFNVLFPQVVVKSAVITSSQAVSTAPAAIFTSNSSSASSSQIPPAPMAPPSSHPEGAPMPPHTMGRPGTHSIGVMVGHNELSNECLFLLFLVLSMQFPPSSPWFVNEMGEAVSASPPPPYSYDPNGNDLPRGQRNAAPWLLCSSCKLLMVEFWKCDSHCNEMYFFL